MSERSILSRGLELRPTRNLIDIGIWSGLMAAVCVAAAPAFAGDVLPTNGTVTAGSASIIRTNPSTLNINQGTNQAIINWNSFSVGHGDTVNFNQPGTSSATLNRVTGTTQSWIAGTINAPGTVLLVNPNGIAITKSGTVNTGSFVGSTLDIKDADFLAGRYKFSGNGASAGVINNGHINVSDGGFAALLGGQVSNNGVIAARLGKVGLGAGEQATLDLSGDGFLSVTVPSSELGHMTRADGALVSNKGKINADGGTVFLSAATASNILRNAVNMGGTIRANSVGTHDGRIVINGGGGNVNVTGKLLAKSRTGTGGEVDITSAGAGVKLVGALIDVSGKTGGGVVNIGGGPHAAVALDEAGSVSLDSTTTIRADATDSGNGGHVVIWSGGQTTAQGTFSAKGGRNGGNGGLVETSGKSVDFNNIVVNASAAKGAAGTWLIDPTDLTIDSAAAATIGTALGNGTSVTLQTNADGSTSGPGVTSAGNGDITVSSNITWSSSSSAVLTLESVHDINLNAGICCGSLTLLASGSVTTAQLASLDTSNTTITAGGNITINGPAILAGATSFTAGGNILTTSQTILGNDPTLAAGGNIQLAFFTTSGGAKLSAFGNVAVHGISNSGGGTITLQADNTGTGTGIVTNTGFITAGGANVAIYYNPASYTSPTNYSSNVSGGSVTAYMLVNSYANLKAINNNLNGNYALGRDVDASASFNDNSHFGWVSLGSSPNGPGTQFTGILDGQNHVISSLAGTTSGPLFYSIGSSGRVVNLGVVNANLQNNGGNPEPMGAIARYNYGTLSNVYSSGAIVGALGNTGGLVGENERGGNITGGSYSIATVTANGGSASAGGLVGQNYGTIQQSYFDGSVHAVQEVGGIVGINWGLVTEVYSLGSVGVSNGGDAGGIAGMNGFTLNGVGTISYSWAAGSLPCACGVNHVGGIVGLNDYLDRVNLGNNAPDVNDWNSNPSAKTAIVYNSYWDVDTTHATTAYSTDYIPYRPNSPYVISNLYNLGALSTNSALGADPYQISSYYYFNSDSNGNGFNSSTQNWFWVPGARPFLSAEYSTTISNSHQLQLVDMNAAANYTLAKDITFTNDGMWSSAGFSPITGLSETTLTYLYYHGYTLSGAGTTTTQNGNVITTVYLEQSFFNQAPQLVNTSYAVSIGGSPFSGTFNGNGHTITGLTENLSGTDGGLFDINAGTIENLGLINPSITTHDATAAGTIAAINVGTIINSWASSNTGALSLNTWNMKATGGLVGYNGGQISQSYANVAVAGVYQSTDPTTPSLFFDNDGGLVGENEGTIRNSYAVGNVYGNGSVGGLVGFNDATIQDTYSTGQVAINWLFGINSAGALVGNNVGTVTGSFWDSTVATFKSGAGTGLTTDQMQNFSTYASVYAGWDFNNVWAPPNKAGQAGLGTAYYPQLYADTAVVFVDVSSANVTYGQSASVSAAMAGGVVDYKFDQAADSMSTPGVTTTATANSNVGSYAVTANVGSTMTSRFGTTYRVIQNTGTVTVTPATLTVTPNGGSSTYNDTALNNTAYSDSASNYSISGFVNGQSASSIGISFSGSMAFNGSTGTSVLNAGTYSLSQGTLAVNSNNSNYVISFSNPASNSYVINQATLTYTANSASMSYGGTVGTLTGTLIGFVGNDNMANSTTGTLAFGTSAGSLTNVGNYAINGSGLTLTNPNYTFAQAGSNATAFAITKALLTVTGHKTYDAGNGFTTSQLAVMGGVNGQTITLTAGTGTSGSANAGTYASASLSGLTISVTGGTGNDLASNYQLPATGTLAIDKANYTAIAGTKTYDGNTNFSGSEITLTGVAGQTFTAVSGTSNSANASGNPNNPSQGFVGVSGPIAGVSGADPNNYVLNIAGLQSNIATINKANYVSLTGSKTYDGNAGFSSLALTGVNGETFTVASATSDFANASTNPNNPASRFVSLSGITGNSGADPNNYAAPLNLGAGSLATNQATINVASYTAIAGTKTYDGSADFVSGQVTLSGVNGETFNVAATSNSSNASVNPNNPATNFVSVSSSIAGIRGADPNNYAPLVVGSLTGANNVATINQANYVSLTGTKTYDGNTGFASSQLALTGVNGETFTVASANSNSANASTNLSNNPAFQFVSLSGITGSNGADPNNYVAPLNLGSLATNTATINVASYTAISGSKTYDGTSDFAGGQVTLSGVNGEMFNVAATSNSANASSNPNNPSTNFVGTSNSIAGNNGADPNNYAPLVVASLTGANNVANINTAALTITAKDQSKTYGDNFDLGTTLFTTSTLYGATDSVTGVTLTSAGANALANVAGGPYAIISSAAVGSGLANYSISYVNGALTVNPAKIVVTALGGSSIYGQSPANLGLSATGLKNGQDASVLTGLFNSFGITNLNNVGSYVLSVAGILTNTNYSITARNTGTWTVTPATLTYVADPSTQFAGSTFSAFTGTVFGFVNGQNLASATTGTAQFDTPATAASTPGTYGIFGSGLTAKHGNYVFAQAPGNATALTLNPPPGNDPSRVPPPPPPAPNPLTGITFQNPNTGANISRVSFTPGTRTANNNSQTGNNNDVNTASLTAGDKFMHNGGRYFPPISQYDAEQYSDFKLPKFAPSDSQATVLTILARGIAQANAAKYMIDGFWNGDGNTSPGEGNTWPGPGHIDLLDKATFSDGAGHNATPTNDPAFPIAAGKTDFAALLNNGPVMIGASSDPRPVQWLLATSMAPDGKGIICDDTMTGKLVELSYDPATRTVGGITKLFDDKSKSFVPLADASNDIPASDASGLSGLQSFVPSTYFAVTVH